MPISTVTIENIIKSLTKQGEKCDISGISGQKQKNKFYKEK